MAHLAAACLLVDLVEKSEVVNQTYNLLNAISA